MNSPEYTVLIIGGYGTFGGRLATLLTDESRLNLIIAGRSLEKATIICEPQSEATMLPCRFDRSEELVDQIEAIKADIMVDASGPFQVYGDDPYRVVRASIACGADYIDLADGSNFVVGIDALDDIAKSAGRFALAGASTCPALTAAVVRELASDLNSLYTITVGISPAPSARLGLNVVRAITDRAGKPIKVLKAGGWQTLHGSVDTRTCEITIPGSGQPLGPLLFSLIDVPDLKLLPTLWPQVRSVWLGAGPVPALSHWALVLAANLVRLRLLPSLTWFVPVMKKVMDSLRWGDDRGGMFVNVTGLDQQDQPAERFWHMVAEGDDGPYIPAMAAAALVGRCLNGDRPSSGARPAVEDISLADYVPQFTKLAITTVTGP